MPFFSTEFGRRQSCDGHHIPGSMGGTQLTQELELLQKQHSAPLFPAFTQQPVGIPMP
jgi:hypothetical protein